MERKCHVLFMVTVMTLLLILSSDFKGTNAFQANTSIQSQTSSTLPIYTPFNNHISFMTKSDNDHESSSTNPSGTTHHHHHHQQPSNHPNIFSRRLIIKTTATAATSSFMLLSNNNNNNNANAFDFNPLAPIDQKSPNNYQFTPAKRATAYLVDSTIPPTLVPFKAQREAAILKGIGSGSGTPKTPYIEESLNLNNMMNKGVFGTIDFVKGVTGLDKDNDDIGVNDTQSAVLNNDPQENDSSANKKGNGYDKSFVFLGVDYNSDDDTTLVIDLIADVIKPRRGLDTALSLSFVPISLQRALNEYIASSSSSSSNADDFIINALVKDGQVPESIVMKQLPLLQYAKSKQLKLIASAPEPIDVQTVRTQGLQNVDPERRSSYVTDALGFIGWTQEPRNKLYTDRSLLKDWTPLDANESTPSGFFAERILVHETIATRMANYAFLDGKRNSLVINVSPIADVRFLGGPNGRIARICKAIKPDTIVDDEAVTTILVNPSAEETLSQSKFIRLEIGTAPSNLAYQTKVADYLWFSSTPKVNMLPRLMNG